MSEVKVFNNDVEKALRKLKKDMIREGMFKEFKKRRHYEKPSDKRRRRRVESKQRQKRAMSIMRRS